MRNRCHKGRVKNILGLSFLVQRMRFKKIASVAASRVESMRDLLIRLGLRLLSLYII